MRKGLDGWDPPGMHAAMLAWHCMRMAFKDSPWPWPSRTREPCQTVEPATPATPPTPSSAASARAASIASQQTFQARERAQRASLPRVAGRTKRGSTHALGLGRPRRPHRLPRSPRSLAVACHPASKQATQARQNWSPGPAPTLSLPSCRWRHSFYLAPSTIAFSSICFFPPPPLPSAGLWTLFLFLLLAFSLRATGRAWSPGPSQAPALVRSLPLNTLPALLAVIAHTHTHVTRPSGLGVFAFSATLLRFRIPASQLPCLSSPCRPAFSVLAALLDSPFCVPCLAPACNLFLFLFLFPPLQCTGVRD